MNSELEIIRYKKSMATGYSLKANVYGQIRNKKYDSFLQKELEQFAAAISSIGYQVIDIGSGPGNESIYLQHKGFKCVCVDFAPGMAMQCKKRGLDSVIMDFYDLGFASQTFAGAWMSFSLLHVPKFQAKQVVDDVQRVILKRGVLYLSLFEGEGEGLRKNDVKKYGCERYFSYYKLEELSQLVTPYFDIQKSIQFDISPRPTISLQCIKR